MTFEDLEKAVLHGDGGSISGGGSYDLHHPGVSEFKRHSLRLLFDVLDDDNTGRGPLHVHHHSLIFP